MTDTTIFQKYKTEYETERDRIEEKLAKLLNGEKPDSLYEPCAYILKSGGKRLRAYLVLLSAKAVGGKYEQAYNAALAVEIFHNFTLVHDDIMDNADKRRGKATLHVLYDMSTAILAGDNLIGIGYKQLLKDCNENAKDVLGIFTQGIIEVCEGQSLDTDFENRTDVAIDEYLTMISKKTAALLEVCCMIGATIGGGDIEKVAALRDYGKYLGLAFQLQDDLLDIMGDESEFGKSVGKDLMEGKKTFLFLKALEKTIGTDDHLLMKKVVEDKGIAKEEVKKYRDIYVKYGVIEETKSEVEKYTNLALKALEKLNDSEAKEQLIWLAKILINRSK